MRVVGLDPSLCNFGIAQAIFDDGKICIESIDVIQPDIPKGKQIRVNTKDLSRAAQLFELVYAHTKKADAVFVEVPVGSQSARAMTSYGICIGILAALRTMGVPIYEVTPTEVKLASVGSKTASKEEMIDWAYKRYPNINWPFDKRTQAIVSSKAEHMADAVAAVHAGTLTTEFKNVMAILSKHK